MEEQLVIVWFPPTKQLIICIWGVGEVGKVSAPWLAFRRHRSWEKTELQTLEPAEKRRHSWVLVLEFS